MEHLQLQHDDTITVQEAMLAGADFKMLCAIHEMHTICMEIAETAKNDFGKLFDMKTVVAEVSDFQEKLTQNMRALSAQYPKLSGESMIEETKKAMEGFDFTGLRACRQELRSALEDWLLVKLRDGDSIPGLENSANLLTIHT